MRRERRDPPLPTILWLSLRAHWIAGLLPLVFLTEISRAGLAAATAAFLFGALLDRAGTERTTWHRLSTPLVLTTVLAAAADLFAGSRDLLSAVTLLVLGVQSVKFLLPKTTRDGWQLCAISFLEFLAAAAVSSEIQFALFLFLFLGLSAGAMWALHLEEEAERRETAAEVRPGFAARLLSWAAVAGFVMTAVLFVTIPRIGIGHILRHLNRSSGISGFADTITLRDVTSVKTDRSVAARIEFPELAPSTVPTDLYFRGAVYPRFDGSRWRRGGTPLAAVPRSGFYYLAGTPPRGEPLSTAEIVLEPASHPALFVYGTPVIIEGDLGHLWTDLAGTYSFQEPVRSAVRYRIRFAKGGSARERLLPAAREEALALPSGMEDVRGLSERIAAGAMSDREKAERFLSHFRSGFRYTLDDPAGTLREFLFVRKAGFCEHYATGLALLLRAAGIPARVAAGYLGGEWSPPGNYLIVRQSDAHAWTEGWIEGRWVTLDATPPAGEGSPFFVKTGVMGIYLDWARQRWNKYVINYSLKMQAEAVSRSWTTIRRARWSLRDRIRGWEGLPRGRTAAGAAVVAACAVSLAWILRKRFRPPVAPGTGRAGERLPRSTARLLKFLASKGFRGSPGTTLEEMLDLAVKGSPFLAEEAARFLRLYHRDRFGPCPLPEEESRESARLADRLRRGLSRPGTA